MTGREKLEELVLKMYREGRTIKEIREATGLSCSQIYSILKRHNTILRRGSYNSKGRVTEEEVAEICRLYAMGWSIYAIAKKLGRPPSTIHYVLKRQGFKAS